MAVGQPVHCASSGRRSRRDGDSGRRTRPKFTFILFWKENNPATQGMTEALKRPSRKRSQRAEWTSVNITDPAQRAIVERYHVERAPMPMVLCVAPQRRDHRRDHAANHTTRRSKTRS